MSAEVDSLHIAHIVVVLNHDAFVRLRNGSTFDYGFGRISFTVRHDIGKWFLILEDLEKTIVLWKKLMKLISTG